MRKRNVEGCYRAVKTTQELRYACKLNRENEDSDHSRYTRGKRRRGWLRNAWDDVRMSSWHMRKSWKEKRGKQYYGRKQLQEFKIVSDGNSKAIWIGRNWCYFLSKEQEYLEKMKIPHKVACVYETEIEIRTKRWRYGSWLDGTTDGYVTCEPFEVRHIVLVKETITYWAEKEAVFE